MVLESNSTGMLFGGSSRLLIDQRIFEFRILLAVYVIQVEMINFEKY